MSNPERTNQAGGEATALESGFFPAAEDAQMVRIRRIGKHLFSVASCLVQWYGVAAEGAGERSMAAIETAFCHDLPPLGCRARGDRYPGGRRAGQYIARCSGRRISAFMPAVRSAMPARPWSGALHLLDYAPREFGEQERELLLDLAAQVERELRLQTAGAAQLDLLKKNKSLRRDSLLDPLIGTWNRVAITRLAAVEKERCNNNRQPLSLVLVGVDHFKKLNDSLGQSACDTILLKIASRLRSCIRPGDALGRYIGDQLLVVLPGASHVVAESVAERMRRAIMLPPELGSDASSVTVSIGSASTNLFPSATAEDLIRHTDLALYAAKGAGRNCVVQARPPLS